jgi:hypothetical protein
MNFLRKNLFLKLIKRILEKKTIKQRHVAAPGCATWHADVSMTSSGGVRDANISNGPC